MRQGPRHRIGPSWGVGRLPRLVVGVGGSDGPAAGVEEGVNVGVLGVDDMVKVCYRKGMEE